MKNLIPTVFVLSGIRKVNKDVIWTGSLSNAQLQSYIAITDRAILDIPKKLACTKPSVGDFFCDRWKACQQIVSYTSRSIQLRPVVSFQNNSLGISYGIISK